MGYFPEHAGKILGQEDCLYLNVYSPKLDSEAKLAVMVWIHGGGFYMGSATSDMYGPEFFMDHNVVLVTIHYRLGVLGFLSFGDSLLPGNLGMKDQVVALCWVKDNIQQFGGDPDSITIFGESAGAASVDFHLVSPLSHGLFHKAILQSGSSYNSWALLPHDLARDRALFFTTLAGCPTESSEAAVDCLRKLPVHKFVTLQQKLFVWEKSPMILFAPVVEPHSSPLNFLPSHPIKLSHPRVPVIMGLNFREGGILAAPFCSDDYKLTKELSQDLLGKLPIVLGTVNTVPYEESDIVVKKLSDFYLNGQPLSEHTFDGFIDMVTDLCFSHGLVKSTKQHKPYGQVYFYLYNYELPVSFNDLFGNCSRNLGVTHGDELKQFFPLNFLKYNLTEEEQEFSKQMLHLWTSFAREGYPDHEVWAPVSSEDIDYLYISKNGINQERGLFTDAIKFIDSLPLQFINDIDRMRQDRTEL